MTLYSKLYKDSIVTNKLGIYFIDLVKFRKIVKTVNSKLAAWLSFIGRGNKKMLEEAKEYEETIQKAEKILNDLKENEEVYDVV